jgi:hypothetical protein
METLTYLLLEGAEYVHDETREKHDWQGRLEIKQDLG